MANAREDRERGPRRSDGARSDGAPEDVGPAPIFVVGRPRSGTHLVRVLLGRLSNVSIGLETHYFSRWVRRSASWELAPDELDAFWKEFSRDPRFLNQGVASDDVLERIRRKGPATLKTVFDATMEARADLHAKQRWGEKTPGHERYLDTMLDWYPEARVVFMVRDPKAIVASLRHVRWRRGTTQSHVERWKESARLWLQWRRDRRVLGVRYEDLVRRPQPEFARICEFVGEPFEPAFERTGPPSRTGPELPDENPAFGAVDPGGTERWRCSLTGAEARWIERAAEPEYSQLGYERAAPRATPREWIARLIGRSPGPPP